ncbi:MAG: hypothetical protein E7643_01495 [Ruminococcaceae bacterium]|nr:hypothetical protein [Oscillospiraceae bacterium]
MKKRKGLFFATRARIERLEEEVEALKASIERRGQTLSELLTEGTQVPLSQVISEYLYGEEGARNE